jgi:beta-xylosidase
MKNNKTHGIFIVAAAILAATGAVAQTTTWPTPEASRDPHADRSSPPFSSPADVYSGISGPGAPVEGDGYGGYRTGRDGVMYKGTAPPKTGWLDLGDKASGSAVRDGFIPPLRPIWELHLRDTIIKRGPDGTYYMTGSSGDNIWDRNDGVELWHSTDLIKWDYLGLVWSVDKDGTWQKKLRYVWAPEIHYVGGAWVLALCMSGGPGGGTFILKSTSGKPEGPYANPMAGDTTTSGGIDATLFQDDDGKVYFTNGGGGSVRLLKPDFSGFEGPAQKVEVEHPADATWREGQVGMEGVSMFKRNGIYYLTAAAFYHGRYSSVAAISPNLLGPYTHWHEAVPCGGGGDYFQDDKGNWYCTYFGNDGQTPWREKPGIVRIDFDAEGKIFIADDQPAFVLQPGSPTHWRTSPPVTPH